MTNSCSILIGLKTEPSHFRPLKLCVYTITWSDWVLFILNCTPRVSIVSSVFTCSLSSGPDNNQPTDLWHGCGCVGHKAVFLLLTVGSEQLEVYITVLVFVQVQTESQGAASRCISFFICQATATAEVQTDVWKSRPQFPRYWWSCCAFERLGSWRCDELWVSFYNARIQIMYNPYLYNLSR